MHSLRKTSKRKVPLVCCRDKQFRNFGSTQQPPYFKMQTQVQAQVLTRQQQQTNLFVNKVSARQNMEKLANSLARNNFSQRNLERKVFWRMETHIMQLKRMTQGIIKTVQQNSSHNKNQLDKDIQEIQSLNQLVQNGWEQLQTKLNKLSELEQLSKQIKMKEEQRKIQFICNNKQGTEKSINLVQGSQNVKSICSLDTPQKQIHQNFQQISSSNQQGNKTQTAQIYYQGSKDSPQSIITQLQSQIQQAKTQSLSLKQQNLYQQDQIQLLSQFINSKQQQIKKILSLIAQKKSYIQIQINVNASKQHQRRQYLQKMINRQELIQKLIGSDKNDNGQFYLVKKQLNNTLQNMRGNVRVYCRIRGGKGETNQNMQQGQNRMPKSLNMNYTINSSNELLKIKRTLKENMSYNMDKQVQFVFDRVFDVNTRQEQVFAQISQLIQVAIDGINVCIFAYGQTGSGKTFTMQGISSSTSETIGLIPRSTQLIFSQLQKHSYKISQQSQLSISVNQIYNDTVINLLAQNKLQEANRILKPVFTAVMAIQQVEELFKKATSNRSTAFTLSNADSSRSHLIFIIRIRSCNAQFREKSKQSHLVLIDLAGSERVKQSGVQKQRLKQAQHINSSLAQLGQVIRSLKNNQKKTNFRNSKLTYFIQPYLQKGTKAIMFVNISPMSIDESQSISSLKFASIARECRLGKDE